MIDTPRLRLRPCRETDKPFFAAILNTPVMTAELGGVRTAAAMDALVDKRIRDQARHGMSYWAVELRDTGEIVGTCGVRIADNYPGVIVEGMHETGWRIAQAHWGQGFAREAANASLVWAWANTPAREIAAWTTIGNTRSWSLMERLGMTRRRELDFIYPGVEADDPAARMIVYTIERPPSAHL